MGYIADLHYEMALEQEMDWWEETKSLSDEALKETLLEIMSSEEYEENEYTELTKNILKFDSFSVKQRRVLEYHYFSNAHLYAN